MSDRRIERGRLQIWLGYAAGVGKTYTMLSAAHRLVERGEDVVIGYVETHGRVRVQQLLKGLETVPRRTLEHRGSIFEEMDVEAVRQRRPRWVIVDELAHTNVEGSQNEKRWQDIEILLQEGISVLSTVNIQHLESLNDTVERITGVKQRETVPDSVVRAADQIDLVDVAPDALRRRLARGDVYPPEKIDAALANYFREGNLTALRELALLWLADRVDEELLDYMDRYEIRGPWETRERIIVAVSGKESDMHLVRRAARMAARSTSDLLTVHVVSAPGGDDDGLLVRSLAQLTADLGGSYHEVVGSDEGEDIAEALLAFARAENATQLLMGSSSRSRWNELLQGSVVTRVVRGSGPIDVHVISTEATGQREIRIPRRRPGALPRRRQTAGLVIALVGLPLLTLILTQLRDQVTLSSVLLFYLCLVVVVAAVGGWRPAILAAIASDLLVNWYFTPPIHTWTISEPGNVFALVVFLVVAWIVSYLVSLESRNRLEAARGHAEADALARMAGSLSEELDPLPSLLRLLRASFGLEAVSVLRRTEGRHWQVEASAGPEPPEAPGDGTIVSALGDDAVLVVRGSDLPAEDQRVVTAFVAQLSVALRSRRLASEAASAMRAASLNELRAAILNAVSHDLRTPLTGIKAAVSSLRQPDVAWSDKDQREFLETIEEEADRLNGLVGNILDMSRLQAGAVTLSLRPVGIDEVVPVALGSLPPAETPVQVRIPDDLSRVRADPAMLERALANVIDNAVAWSPTSQPVLVMASEADHSVELRVVDRGPGIPDDGKKLVFEPFQRLGDRPREGGLGLGFAVAKGLIEAMEGTIELEDTPGGGLTVVIGLEAVT
jgi:two-component system sensor histidine kinase KdpD